MYQDDSSKRKRQLIQAKAMCPCGSMNLFEHCCYPIMLMPEKAAEPEQLMRSRYTAFCLKDVDHLIATHHPSRRAPDERSALKKQFATEPSTVWLGLEIREVSDTHVTFLAKYRDGANQPNGLLERSTFIKEQGALFYLEGEIKPTPQPERNAPCWCNSGKKSKKCCFK